MTEEVTKCALCLERKPKKKNTHYLTDSIIKTALNEEGSDVREKGSYFNMSDNVYFTDYNFQRKTSGDEFEKVLGRLPNDEEIKKSKAGNPYSVDGVFCKGCEDIFSSIESPFIDKFLSTFRDNDDIENDFSISYSGDDDIKLIRLFFLLQVWRTAICEDIFSLTQKAEERLRVLILKNFDSSLDDLKKEPLSISYLNTLGKQGEENKEYTKNAVGAKFGKNPNVIFMNDFVIQYYNNGFAFKFDELYGLNYYDEYKDYINYKEDGFVIQISSNEERLEFLEKLSNPNNKIKNTIEFYQSSFIAIWKKATKGRLPPISVQKAYIKGLFDYDDIPLAKRLSMDRVFSYTVNFLEQNGITIN